MTFDFSRWLLVIACAWAFVGCKAKIGDSCSTSVNCSQSGDRLCDVTQPGGYCTKFNCEPDTCPDESACIAFDASLSQACGDSGLSRLTRSYCLFNCGDDGDCRSGYVCGDLTTLPNAWNAALADPGRSGKVCLVPASAAVPFTAGDPPICSAAGGSGSGGAAGLGGNAGGGGASAGSAGAGGVSAGSAGEGGAGGADSVSQAGAAGDAN